MEPTRPIVTRGGSAGPEGSRRHRRLGLVAALAGAAAGVLAAVAAYGSTSVAPTLPVSAGSRAPAVVGRPLPAPPPRIEVRTLPCPQHARLVHGVCVTRVVRTVVVHDLPAPAPAVAQARAAGPTLPRAQASAAVGRSDGDGDSEDHEGAGDD
ncbi:MAG: hypothetical protein ACXVYW_17420 [Oryzihumus sp.]